MARPVVTAAVIRVPGTRRNMSLAAWLSFHARAVAAVSVELWRSVAFHEKVILSAMNPWTAATDAAAKSWATRTTLSYNDWSTVTSAPATLLTVSLGGGGRVTVISQNETNEFPESNDDEAERSSRLTVDVLSW